MARSLVKFAKDNGVKFFLSYLVRDHVVVEHLLPGINVVLLLFRELRPTALQCLCCYEFVILFKVRMHIMDSQYHFDRNNCDTYTNKVHGFYIS